MSDTLTIKKPAAPEGHEIVDCRPPKEGEWYWNWADRKPTRADRDFQPLNCRYILRRVRTDTERLDALFNNRWRVYPAMGGWSVARGGNAAVIGKTRDTPRAAIDNAMDKAEQT